MRSSNYKHLKHETRTHCKHAKRENNSKKYSKLGSILVSVLIVFSAIVIPSVTLVQNVEAVTSAKNATFSIGSADVFSDIIAKSDKEKPEKKEKTKKASKKVEKKVEEKVSETTPTEAVTEEATAAVTQAPTQAPTEAETQVPSVVSVAKNYGLLSITDADTSYTPVHVSLSDYDREKLERLVMGEAGSLGYTGSALVAQAIRDSMILSGTSSIDEIISSYQYTGSTAKKPTQSVKNAVAYIFDNDGYAVQHRILYFYASNMVKNAWHESQQFIVSYGNVRFFDRW